MASVRSWELSNLTTRVPVSLDLLEDDLRGVDGTVFGEVRLHGHAVEHFSKTRRGASEVRDLPRAQIDGNRSDLAGLVPGAVLVRDGDDALGAVGFNERLNAAPEKVEVLGHEIE